MSIETPKIIRRNCHYDKRGYLQEIYLKKKKRKYLNFHWLLLQKKMYSEVFMSN